MRVKMLAARVFAVLAVVIGGLGVAATATQAEEFYGGGPRPGFYHRGGSYYGHGGYRPGWGGGYRPGPYRPGYGGGFIYNRPGDGLPPLPARRVPGGIVVNRPGDGIPPVFIPR